MRKKNFGRENQRKKKTFLFEVVLLRAESGVFARDAVGFLAERAHNLCDAGLPRRGRHFPSLRCRRKVTEKRREKTFFFDFLT